MSQAAQPAASSGPQIPEPPQQAAQPPPDASSIPQPDHRLSQPNGSGQTALQEAVQQVAGAVHNTSTHQAQPLTSPPSQTAEAPSRIGSGMQAGTLQDQIPTAIDVNALSASDTAYQSSPQFPPLFLSQVLSSAFPSTGPSPSEPLSAVASGPMLASSPAAAESGGVSFQATQGQMPVHMSPRMAHMAMANTLLGGPSASSHFSMAPTGSAALRHNSAALSDIPPAQPQHPSGVVPHIMQVPTHRLTNRPSQPTSARRSANLTPPEKLCNCRNSKCLKLYCECFASGRYCNACNCLNCMNNKDYEAQRSKAIENILERNPNAFRPKIQFQQGEDGAVTQTVTRHSRGCSCRKSNCLKKYCECFQAGIFCAATCRCKECRNYDGSEHLLAVMDTMETPSASQPVLVGPPDAKRTRVMQHRLSKDPASHYSIRKVDPARQAIRTSRDKKLQQVLASMLTQLHVEAFTSQQKRQELVDGNQHDQGVAGAGLAPSRSARDWALQQDAQLSPYYVNTEGILLKEFGNFLGKMADKIDEQLYKGDGHM